MNGAIIKHMQTDMTHDLECINQYKSRPFTEQEVYTFSVVLCDNEIDRDFERFSGEAGAYTHLCIKRCSADY